MEKYSIEELSESRGKFEKLRDEVFIKFKNLWERFFGLSCFFKKGIEVWIRCASRTGKEGFNSRKYKIHCKKWSTK